MKNTKNIVKCDGYWSYTISILWLYFISICIFAKPLGQPGPYLFLYWCDHIDIQYANFHHLQQFYLSYMRQHLHMWPSQGESHVPNCHKCDFPLEILNFTSHYIWYFIIPMCTLFRCNILNGALILIVTFAMASAKKKLPVFSSVNANFTVFFNAIPKLWDH